MAGIVFLLFLILNHMVHNSFKDCYAFYLQKYLKIPKGFLTFISTYLLSLLILYIVIGIFMMVFTGGMYFEYFFRPRYYFEELLDF